MKKRSLYKCNKRGGLQVWTIWTKENVIYVKHGLEKGKQTKSPGIECEPKNAGRTNATTAKEQARMEARAMYTHKLKRRYYKTKEEAIAKKNVFSCMLAKPAQDHMDKIRYPVDTQNKLDGVRMTAEMDEHEVIHCFSREGLPIEMPHIEEQLGRVMRKGYRLDGELFAEGMKCQDIVSLMRNPHSKRTRRLLGYWIYDIPTDPSGLPLPWRSRKVKLNYLDERIEREGCDHLEVLDTVSCKDWDDVVRRKEVAIGLGLEGLILRDTEATYQHTRTHFLLKLKDMQDAEYKVMDAEGGRGKHKDAVKWLCQVPGRPKLMPVVHKCKAPQRKEYLANKAKYIGKMLTVQFFELTKDGVPRFPVGLRFRGKGE